ncbi:hypothetical protein BDV95DRAFT_601363 [Massariosphaeria phaeospora]|uniref:RING-type domain-containing protein n=1 Tax=Massariosphaeria phaeospora TaxID=100035 RepID=A0A7C8IHV4_9PLEO|nr:hypothetical protein BDV95DRAFT_601363 [Massariosphaeria phaeospora]
MAAYPTKALFEADGLEPFRINAYAVSQVCAICCHPLIVNPSTPDTTNNNNIAHPTRSSSTFHPATRIKPCGHVLGAECLAAWLTTGHTCPICARTLFPAAVNAPVSQRDINAILDVGGHIFGEGRVMGVVAGLLEWDAVQQQQAVREEERVERENRDLVWWDDNEIMDWGGGGEDEQEEGEGEGEHDDAEEDFDGGDEEAYDDGGA